MSDHEVEKVMGGVWIFGQLILFSMWLGSKDTNTTGERCQTLFTVGAPQDWKPHNAGHFSGILAACAT